MSGNYFSYIGFEPRNPTPGETTKIIFSIQDENWKDLYNLETMVEVFSAGMEKRLFVESWNKQEMGGLRYHISLKIQEHTR